MTEQTQLAAEKPARQKPEQGTPEAPTAIVKKSRWPGWIWAVPIAALAIVIYLGVRSIVQGGPSVTVTFDAAPGVKADQTNVEYEGSEVGQVQSVKWHKDLQAVDVVLSMNADMDGHLGPGTRYWIAGENVGLANLSSIKSIISGPHIGIEPHPGKTVHHARGLSKPPVVTSAMRGTIYTLHAPKLGSVSRGSQVYYLGMKVGRVVKYTLTDHGHGFDFTVYIEAPYDRFVHAGSRFWNVSAIDFTLTGSGPSVRLESVPALLEGAVAFETPSGAAAGPLAPPDARFTLYDGKEAAENAAPLDGVEYVVKFDGAATSIPVDAPVKLLDQQIGAVRRSAVQYDSTAGRLLTEATLVLDPAKIEMTGLPAGAAATPRQRMNALLKRLVANGLRAELSRNPPLIGSEQVVLRFVKGAPEPPLSDASVPEIPTSTPPGGEAGMQGVVARANGLMDQASGVVDKLNRVPIDAIGRDVHTATERLAKLSTSPQLTRSLRNLERSVTNIEKVTTEARERVGPMLAELQQTLASTKSLVSGLRGGQSQNQVNAAGLSETLYELNRAARSVRELSNFLDRHPESLLTGRKG